MLRRICTSFSHVNVCRCGRFLQTNALSSTATRFQQQLPRLEDVHSSRGTDFEESEIAVVDATSVEFDDKSKLENFNKNLKFQLIPSRPVKVIIEGIEEAHYLMGIKYSMKQMGYPHSVFENLRSGRGDAIFVRNGFDIEEDRFTPGVYRSNMPDPTI